MSITRIAIAGSTGYSGQELLRLLGRHQHFKVSRLIGREDSLKDLKNAVDLAFLCTPNETSLELASKLLDLGIHVIDVSGAFRLKKHKYPEWYGFEHTAPALLARAEYALNPWLKISPVKSGAEPRLIANPGCYPTACLLAVLPLVKAGLIQPESVVLDAKSGTSGAGRKAETHLLFSEIFGEFKPYKIGRHQHWPEIVEATELFSGVKINPCFTTSLLPLERGISVSLYAEWSADLKKLPLEKRLAGLHEAYQKAYSDCPDILAGSQPELGSLKKVINTNRCHIQFNEAFGKVMVFSVIDNLLRGAAGQALMNANRLAGLDEQEGLTS